MIGARAVWEVEEKAKERRLKLAGSAHYLDLKLARETARALGAGGQTVTADEVRRAMLGRFPDQEFGPWMGQLFREPGVWMPVGFVRSSTPGAHRRVVQVWRLR